MKIALSKVLCLLAVFPLSIVAQREKSALLPADQAKEVTSQCSRQSPKFTDTWEPSKDQIKEMESAFSRIKGCCKERFRLGDLSNVYMQYAGIVVDGKKLIYINAFSEFAATIPVRKNDGTYEMEKSDWWKTSAVIVCDGGSAFWGVLYDPKSKKFFDLAVNGVG